MALRGKWRRLPTSAWHCWQALRSAFRPGPVPQTLHTCSRTISFLAAYLRIATLHRASVRSRRSLIMRRLRACASRLSLSALRVPASSAVSPHISRSRACISPHGLSASRVTALAQGCHLHACVASARTHLIAGFGSVTFVRLPVLFAIYARVHDARASRLTSSACACMAHPRACHIPIRSASSLVIFYIWRCAYQLDIAQGGYLSFSYCQC